MQPARGVRRARREVRRDRRAKPGATSCVELGAELSAEPGATTGAELSAKPPDFYTNRAEAAMSSDQAL